jgi:hypothetical protein
MAVINWDDPCAVVPVLKRAYYQLTSGNKVASITYQTMGVTRTMMYSVGDLGELKQALTQAQAECAEAQGKVPVRRRAIVFGSRRFNND